MILGMICAACMTVRSSANLTLSETGQNYTRDRVGCDRPVLRTVSWSPAGQQAARDILHPGFRSLAQSDRTIVREKVTVIGMLNQVRTLALWGLDLGSALLRLNRPYVHEARGESTFVFDYFLVNTQSSPPRHVLPRTFYVSLSVYQQSWTICNTRRVPMSEVRLLLLCLSDFE